MITIVTDSSSGLTRAAARRLGARVVPMYYQVGGRTYRDGYADENGDYFPVIFQNRYLPRTVQTPVEDFKAMFSMLCQEEENQVLCLTISSRLSGTYQNALQAAADFGGRVKVVDSLTVAGALALLVEQARHAIRQGAGLEEAARLVEEARLRTRLYFTVGSMANLRRSRRLGTVRQGMGNILHVQPVLTCRQGLVHSCKMVRGQRLLLAELAALVPENARQVVLHFQRNKKAAQQLLSALKLRCRQAQFSMDVLGPVLSIHLGEGVLAVAWLESAE